MAEPTAVGPSVSGGSDSGPKMLSRARNLGGSGTIPRSSIGSASMVALPPRDPLKQDLAMSDAAASVLATLEAQQPAQTLNRRRSKTIQVGNLANERALKERMEKLAMLSEAMDDDVLRRVRYSNATMGDGVSKEKNFGVLSKLATFEEELYLDDLEVIKPLGYGAFSTVELVRVPASHPLSTNSEQRLFAVKRINVPTAASPYGGGAPLLPPSEVSAFDGISMMAEGALMKNLRHPNILTCYGAIGRRAAATGDEHAGDGKAVVRRSALILDYAPGGTLRQRIDKKDYPPHVAVEWLLGVARGMCYLHELHGISVAHRDLKPSNILLGADGQPKIADLGLFRLMKGPTPSRLPTIDASHEDGEPGVAEGTRPSLGGRRGTDSVLVGGDRSGQKAAERAVDAAITAKPRWRLPTFTRPRATSAQPAAAPSAGAPVKPPRMTGRTGTVVYMAPENWRAKAGYTQKVDIYSFAIIAWEILMQTIAYDDLDIEPEIIGEWVAERGMRPYLPARWPDKLGHLIKTCWGTEPETRPSAREVVTALERFTHAAQANPALYEALAVHPRTKDTVLTAFNQTPTSESWIKSLGMTIPGRRRRLSDPAAGAAAGAATSTE